jgi:quercetin dioxygenase-like cupin family protein
MSRVAHQPGSRVIGRTLSLAMIVAGILILILFANVSQSGALAAQGQKAPASKWVTQLPEGTGKNLIVAKCQFCHSLQQIVVAHRPKSQWQDTIDSMAQMGAPVTDAETSTIVDYLTANFGPAGSKPAVPQSALASGTTEAFVDSAANLLVNPDQTQFSPVPDAMGSVKDVRIFVISGDPLKRGPFSVLLKISPGAVVPSNWLSGAENIVCLRGTFQVGEGDTLEASKLQTLNPGAVFHIASQAHHLLGQAKDGAIILISGDGPASIVDK